MIRIIHTADLHLDACFARVGLGPAEGNRRRQSLRDLLHRILQRAVEWPAHAVLIAGDLFEHDRITRDTVTFLRAEFDAVAPIPIFIAAGNRDPYVPGSPYATEVWPDNVTIFTSPNWTSKTLKNCDLTVHGFGFDGPEPSSNPFTKLQFTPDGKVHVAVAHGAEKSATPLGKTLCAPFLAHSLTLPELSYMALGHIHLMRSFETEQGVRIQYSGAPEGLSFSDTGMRHYLEVEIDAGGVQVRPVACSKAVFSAHTIDCSSFTTTQEIVDAVRALPSDGAQTRIVQVTLAGTGRPEWRYELEAMRARLADDFEFVSFVDAMRLPDDYEVLARDCTSQGAFVARINAELVDTTDLRRRRVLERARELGVSAYRSAVLPAVPQEKG
ncbi:MAG: DNA repair exonuclease [Candidatus Hydrogenedentes bacterium]|nr:DNA repair exonuclease [Candidatus Hydrogenedentota bacterium]